MSDRAAGWLCRPVRAATAALGAALAAAATLPAGIAAAADPARELGAVEQAIAGGEARRALAARQRAAVEREIERLRAEAVAAAAAVQARETALTEIEAALAEARADAARRLEALDRRRDRLATLLSTLQRLARRPPEATLLEPGGPVAALRTARLLGHATAAVDSEAAALRGELDTLRIRVAEAERHAADERREAVRLAGERRALDEVVAKRRAARAALAAEESRRARDVERLATRAENLRDLIQRLEEERRRQEAAARREAERLERERREAAERVAAERAMARREAERLDAERRAAARREAERRTALGPSDPGQAETGQAESGQANQGRADQGQTDQGQTDQGQTDQGQTDQGRAADGRTETARLAPAPPAVAPRGDQTALPSFVAARGAVRLPVAGRVLRRYGEDAGYGSQSRGLTIQSRRGATVVAPYHGRILFVGPFRGYGEILIIEHTDGYHSVLAGLARADGTVGQRVVAGEPVGAMASDGADSPKLYVELRRGGQPIDPGPWLGSKEGKVSG